MMSGRAEGPSTKKGALPGANSPRLVPPSANVPRLARLLVAALIRDPSAEFIVGDLDEAYVAEVAAGRSGARLRYWRLALASIWSRARSSARGRLTQQDTAGGIVEKPAVSRIDRKPVKGMSLAGRTGAGGPSGPAGRGSTGLTQDLRFAARVLRKSPGFAAIAILTLALGIGANTAVFSVLNGVLLRPLPYEDPGEVINVWQVFYEWQESEVELFRSLSESFPVSYPLFQTWQERAHPFENLAAYNDFNALVEGPDLAEWVPSAWTSAALFDVLGVEPQLGRRFRPEEDRIGADRVVVISHAFWLAHYGGDRSILGQTLDLTGAPHTIIGVMPPGFYFPSRSEQLWTLLQDRHRNARWRNQSLSVVARLRDGVTLADAQREMDAVTLQIMEDFPDSPEVGIRLVGRVEEVAGDTSNTLKLLMAAVSLVLVVTTANLAGLLLVRATGRRQEIAVRRALGAGRFRLVVQLLIESCLLAAAGGAVGLVTTISGMGWIRTMLPESIPRIEEIGVDGRVLLFTLGVSVVIAVVFGLASAFHAGRHRLIDALRAGGPGAIGARQRGRSVLVMGEIAVAVVLLVGATLLLGSYFRLMGIESGFDEDGLLTFNVSSPRAYWDSPSQYLEFYFAMLKRLEQIPGVEGVATVAHMPFEGGQSSSDFALVANAEEGNGESWGWALENTVSPGYFETMGIPLVRGRLFDFSDSASSQRVTIVNERLAGKYWADSGALGEVIWEDGEPSTIVGVVGNSKHNALSENVEAMRFRVHAQYRQIGMSVAVRTQGDPLSIAPLVRDAVGDLDRRATVADLASMRSLVAETTSLQRFRSLMLTSLATVAVILAVLGIYGVIALSVAERSREIGVRMTLGAVQADILRQVLGSGARLIVPGVILGVVIAVFAVRTIENYLYEVPPTDPLTLAGVALAVFGVAVLAVWIPARRAARIEPLIVLRGE